MFIFMRKQTRDTSASAGGSLKQSAVSFCTATNTVMIVSKGI